MKYNVDGEVFDNIDDVIEYCIDDDYHQDDDYFQEWVNEGWNGVYIAGYEYSAYDIISNADDGCVTSLLEDFCQAMNENDESDARYELDRANIGDTVYCQAYTIHVIEDDDKEETGDYDGDDALEMTRLFIEEQKILKNEALKRENKEEEDFMNIFQKIGG